ncbi:MAG: methionine biosynthesis protein MetW [Pseudomonadota bacterium]|nr:methionine biosynthesis protein MetW [Pseudomonadota bacterium]
MTPVHLEERPDLALIADMIESGARVLDLGCGTGALLAWLAAHKGVNGYGLEIDPLNISTCIERGVNVLEQNLDDDLSAFETGGFDVVVMTETLQAVRRPDRVLEEMLRIAPRGIVTFPNFAHWRIRAQLALRGRMPMNDALPHAWYDTPNIHLCTFDDFETLCSDTGIRINARTVVDRDYRSRPLLDALPNLFGTIAIYGLGRDRL